jgi:acyl-CoA thioesterase-1
MSRVVIFLFALWCAQAPAAAAPAAADAPVVLVFGDSLGAAYGVAPEHGWVRLLSERLRSQGYGYTVVNASVSGETTAGGLARLQRTLAMHRPAVVLLELGGNDGLRGLPPSMTRANLDAMLNLAKGSGTQVLLLGIRMPPNYGPRYTGEFDRIYAELAQAHRLRLVPFLLAGVAGQDGLMQADGIHPNEHGQPVLLDNVWPQLLPLLKPGSASAAQNSNGRG